MSTNCTNVKLSPNNNAKISGPFMQEIADTTFDGTTSTLAVTVASDTDLEYQIFINNIPGAQDILVRLNNDNGSNYFLQDMINNAGTITAAQSTATEVRMGSGNGFGHLIVTCPSGMVKQGILMLGCRTSGTTINYARATSFTWNNSAQVTSLNFISNSGNFASGSRVIVYARRA